MLTASDHNKTIALRIRQHRVLAGMSQQKLADALGVTFQQVQKYENARNRISIGALVIIARTLNIQVASLLEGLETSPAAAASPTVDDATLRAISRITNPAHLRAIRNVAQALSES